MHSNGFARFGKSLSKSSVAKYFILPKSFIDVINIMDYSKEVGNALDKTHWAALNWTLSMRDLKISTPKAVMVFATTALFFV